MLIKISEKQLNYILEQAPIQQKPNQFTKFDLANKARGYVPPFTPENFAKEVIKQNVSHPEIAVAQALLESGHFTSDVFKFNNNLFGMRFPRQRRTTAIKENLRHASYKNWVESVKDYKLWQEARELVNVSKNVYLYKLNKIYCIPPSCGSDNYSRQVQSLMSRANELLAKAKSA